MIGDVLVRARSARVALLILALAAAGCDPTVVFDAAPAAIDPGEAATLSWDVSPNGSTTITSVSIEPGFPALASSGSQDVAPIETTTYTLTAVATSSGGKEFTVTSEVTVTVSDPLTCDADDLTGVPASGSATLGATTDFVPLCSGWVLIADDLANTVVETNVVTGASGATYALSGPAFDLELDPRRDRLFATIPTLDKLAVIELRDGTVTEVDFADTPYYLSMGADGEVFVSAGSGYWKDLYGYDPLTGAVSGSASWYLDGSIIRYNAARDEILTATIGLSPSRITRHGWDAQGELEELEQVTSGSNGQDLAISPDGAHLALACGGGNGAGYTIFDYDAADLTSVGGEWITGAYPSGVAFNSTSTQVVTSNYDDIQVFDVATHQLDDAITPASCAYGQIRKVGFSRGDGLALGKQTCGFDDEVTKLFWLRVD